LRRWGLKLAERGGKSGKKRAIIATARKLAVLLHRLWVSGEVYEPLYNSQRKPLAIAAQKQKHRQEGKIKSLKPSSGDCVNRLGQLLGVEKNRSTNRWQHRLKRERPTCTERNESLLESANGSMATVATRREEKETCSTKPDQNRLDSDRPSHGRRLHQLPGWAWGGGDPLGGQ
jgi:hypothetical protein